MFYLATHRDEHVLCEPRLPRLLAVLADLGNPGGPEDDTAIWHGSRLIAVMHADGSLTWLAPEYRAAGEVAA